MYLNHFLNVYEILLFLNNYFIFYTNTYLVYRLHNQYSLFRYYFKNDNFFCEYI